MNEYTQNFQIIRIVKYGKAKYPHFLRSPSNSPDSFQLLTAESGFQPSQ